MRAAISARFEPLEEMLTPSFRPTFAKRLEGAAYRSSAMRKLARTVATAYSHAVSFENSSMFVTDYVGDLPPLTLRAWVASGELDTGIPCGFISEMAFERRGGAT